MGRSTTARSRRMRARQPQPLHLRRKSMRIAAMTARMPVSVSVRATALAKAQPSTSNKRGSRSTTRRTILSLLSTSNKNGQGSTAAAHSKQLNDAPQPGAGNHKKRKGGIQAKAVRSVNIATANPKVKQTAPVKKGAALTSSSSSSSLSASSKSTKTPKKGSSAAGKGSSRTTLDPTTAVTLQQLRLSLECEYVSKLAVAESAMREREMKRQRELEYAAMMRHAELEGRWKQIMMSQTTATISTPSNDSRSSQTVKAASDSAADVHVATATAASNDDTMSDGGFGTGTSGSVDGSRNNDNSKNEMRLSCSLMDERFNANDTLSAPLPPHWSSHTTATDSSHNSDEGSSSAAASSTSIITSAASVSSHSAPSQQQSPPSASLSPPHHHPVRLISLSSTDAEWRMVESRLTAGTNGLPSAKLLAVQRIENRALWERYARARQRVMEKYGNESLNNQQSMGNEKLMWHGTRQNQPHLLYASGDGFDVRLSGSGMLGPGSYFSDSAHYSGGHYAHPISQSTQGGGYWYSYNSLTPSPPVIPPLFTLRQGKAVSKPIPPNTFQILLARVVLGTSYVTQVSPSVAAGTVTGSNVNSCHFGRPPVRPFQCHACKKNVELGNLSMEYIKSSMISSKQFKAMTAEPRSKQTKRKRRSSAWPTSRSNKRRRKATTGTQSSTATSSATASVPSATGDGTTTPIPPQSTAEPKPAAVDPGVTMSTSVPPIPCPHCKVALGSPSALFSSSYRYDSVTQGHMSVVYESDRAYPEYLVTFQK